jgi:hypothetical protein
VVIKTQRLSPKTIHTSIKMAGKDWSHPILLTSDQHFDSTHCDRAMLKRHLDEALKIDAPVYIIGDWFDGMQGRSDRRSSKAALRPELKRADYLNALVEETCEFLTPYAHIIQGWAEGNHETSILRYAEFNLISACIRDLHQRTGASIHQMGYSGWIFVRPEGRRNKHQVAPARICYTHGYGGGVVTRGSLNVNRRAVQWPDADCVVSGHIHESYIMEVRRERMSSHGMPYEDTQWHIQTPTYKDEFAGDGSGWWHETGKSPRPKGGWWVDISLQAGCANKVQLSPRRAQ